MDSDFTYEQKHPIIPPKSHPLTDLMNTYGHRELPHAWTQTLIANI